MEKTRNLYFIQVGANIGKNVGGGDPVWEYVRPCHWSGVVVEPMPETYATLKVNYHDLEALNQIVTLNLGVSKSAGYTEMLGGGETASLSTEMKQEKEGSMMVEVVTLKQLWGRVKSHIPLTGVDILVLDVEGNERNILAEDDLPHPLPTRILFEIAHVTQEDRDIIDAKLRLQGYRQSADLIHRDTFAMENNLPAQDRLYELIK
jgi:FkbM family methyltransferase